MPGEREGPVLRDRQRPSFVLLSPLFLKKKIILCIFIYILYVFCLLVCLATTSVPGAQGGAQDVREPLRLELQTSMCMGAGG